MNIVLPGLTTLVAGLLAASPAFADAYKCTSAQGVVSYQDVPCAAGLSENIIDVIDTLPYNPELSKSMKEAAEALRQKDRELAERLLRDSESRRQLAAQTPPPVYGSGSRYEAGAVTTVIPYEEPIGVWGTGVYFPPRYRHSRDPFMPGGSYHQPRWQPNTGRVPYRAYQHGNRAAYRHGVHPQAYDRAVYGIPGRVGIGNFSENGVSIRAHPR